MQASHRRFSDGAKNVMMSYTWPGNVRELANVIERSVILAQDNGSITAKTLSFLKIDVTAGNTVDVNTNGFDSYLHLAPEGICLEKMEKDLVIQALKATNYNQAASARMLGVSRSRFRVLYKQAMGNDA